MNRRDFLSTSAKAGLTTAIGAGFISAGSAAVSSSPSEKITLAMIGLGGRGDSLTRGFLDLKGVSIAYLCDPDPKQHPDLSDLIKTKSGHEPKRVTDYRRVLDDKSVDAVVIAAPDHWHCPLTVFACMAGKDVYVEKPLSFNIWEGRKAVEAARKHKRVVQVGMQSRSAPYMQHAKQYILDAKLGKIAYCRVCNLKSGGPFKQPPNSDPPAGVDYNLWLGPAPEHAFNAGRFHKQWHNYWDYSGGDMANDGVHQLDVARWMLDKDCPTHITSTGGNYAFKDDNETPETQTAEFQFDDAQLHFEQIGFGNYMLKEDPTVRSGEVFPLWQQYSTRIELYGTKGLMFLGRHGGGWQVFTRPTAWKQQLVTEEHGRFPDKSHKVNFLDCIRSREKPNADVEKGHHSAAMVHLANISYRLGGVKLDYDHATETIRNNPEANRFLKRENARQPFAIPDAI
jgi:predicted dehydrogenase